MSRSRSEAIFVKDRGSHEGRSPRKELRATGIKQHESRYVVQSGIALAVPRFRIPAWASPIRYVTRGTALGLPCPA